MVSFSFFRKHRYWYLYFLIIAFLFLKMIRGVYGGESSGGGVWNIIQVLFVLLGVVFFFSKYNRNSRSINVFFVFSIWQMIVSLLNMIYSPIDSLSSWFYLFTSPCAPSVLLLFYCVTQKYDIHDFAFLIKTSYYVLILMFYYSMARHRIAAADEYIAFSDIYYPLCLLPLVLLLTKTKRTVFPLLAVMLGIIVSGKRGGLVIVAIVAFVYYFFGENKRKSNKIFVLLLFSVLVVISSLLINYIDSVYGLHTIDRMMHSKEDGGSGRFSRWDILLSAIGKSDLWELIFGRGFGAVYGLIGGRAHNDFIEIFYNFGLITVVLYVVFYLRLFVVNFKQYRCHYPYAKYMTCSIIVSLVLAMVSFFIVEPTYVLASMFVTGLLLGDWNKFSNNSYQIN